MVSWLLHSVVGWANGDATRRRWRFRRCLEIGRDGGRHATFRQQLQLVQRRRRGAGTGGRTCLQDAGDAVAVEQVVGAQLQFHFFGERERRVERVVREQVGDSDRVDGERLVRGAVVAEVLADALDEHADVPALVLVAQAQRLGVFRRAGHPLAGVVFGAAVAAVQVGAEAAADDDIAFGLNALVDLRAVQIVDRVAEVIEAGRVGAIELGVEDVDVERVERRFPDGADLVGLRRLRLGLRGDGGVLDVEDAGRRDQVTGAVLAVQRPVRCDHVVRVQRRQHVVILHRVAHVGRAVQRADRAAVVGQVVEGLLVVGVFDAGRDLQVRRDGELEFGERLQRRGLIVLAEVGHRVVDPVQRIGRILVTVAARVVAPQAGAQGAQREIVAQAQQVAAGAVGIELVDAGLVGRGVGQAGGHFGAVVVLLVPVAVGIDLVVELPAVAQITGQAEVFEIGGDVVEVVAVVVGLRRVAAEQIVVAVLGDLRARRSLDVGGVVLQVQVGAEGGQHGVAADGVLVFERGRAALLVIIGLVAIGLHVLHVEQQVLVAVFAELAGLVFVAVHLRVPAAQARNTASATLSSWNTQMYSYEHETGQFGENGNQNLLFNVQDMKSDGYQTYNDQKRGAASFKYQNAISSDTMLTAFGSYLNLKNNTANIKGPTRAQIAQYGDDYLLSGDPTQPNYYGYNFYNITTDFEYLGLTSNLGNGWKLDDKVYTNRYWNKQNYDGTKVPTSLANTTANQTGVDKLNSYRTSGNLLRLSDELALGTLRTGLWSDYARSYRYQYPTNPLNWVDNAVPNFSEHYQTTTLQPFAEFEFAVTPDLKITPGIKYAHYKQAFDHLADNGGAVGSLNGAPDVRNTVQYHDMLPSLDAHYMIASNWSLYGQYGTGDLIPPTSVFDVKNAAVATQPKPQTSKTYQIGTVWKSPRYTLDVDVFHTKLDGAYSSSLDNFGNAIYYLNGTQINKGVEAEGNVVIGGGFSAYLNGSYGSAKYDTGKWVAGAPKDTETLGLSYKHQSWDVGMFVKRVGQNFSDNGATHEAFTIDPVTVANLFANYSFNTPFSFTKKVKLQLGANNLFNRHSITSVLKAGTATSSSAAPSPLDQLQLLPERSVSATISADF